MKLADFGYYFRVLPFAEYSERYYTKEWNYSKEKIEINKLPLAAEMLLKHINNNSHIAIVSDSDCDGLTAAATTYRILRNIFKHPEDKISVLINKRKNGNSFNPTLVSRVKELHKHRHIDLMYSCDQGSLNGPEYKDFAKTCGFDMIITDHHQVRDGFLYPKAPNLVFINPNDLDNTEEESLAKGLSGCAVTLFTLMETYVLQTGKKKEKVDYTVFYPYFDLPALSVISDVMPCDNEINRWIYKIGSNILNRKNNVLGRALRFVLEIPGKIELSDIKMKIAPFINSANRMDVEDLGFNILIHTDYEKVVRESEELVLYNKEKKNIIRDLTKDLIKGLETIDCSDGIIVTIKDVAAVNGIIAGKIGSIKRVPTVCFIEKEDTLSGSCRAIVPGFDLIELFTRISKQDPNVLSNFGGHKDACGIHVRKDYLEVFQGLFFQNVHDMLADLPKDQKIGIDKLIKEEDFDIGLVYSQNSLAPYGKNFKEPTYLSIFYIKHVISFGDIAKVVFKRRNGGSLYGFYSFGTTDYINIHNIKEVLKSDVKCLVSYTAELGSYANAYDINLNLIKIDIL